MKNLKEIKINKKLEGFSHAVGNEVHAKVNSMNTYFTSMGNPYWRLSHLNCCYPFKNEYP